MGRKPISVEQYEQVRVCLKKHMTLKQAAKATGLGEMTVHRIKHSRGYMEYLRELRFRTHRVGAFRHLAETTEELKEQKQLIGNLRKSGIYWHNKALEYKREIEQSKAKPSKKWYWPF